MSSELIEEKSPIRGWLILVAIMLWISVIFIPLSLPITLFGPHIFAETYFVLFSTLSEILLIPTLVFFIGRRRRFVSWFIGTQVWGIITLVVSIVFIPNYNVYRVVFAFIEGLALLFYVLRSKRVKSTFVR